jgi:transcriptional regulator with XRE-family HTH domain
MGRPEKDVPPGPLQQLARWLRAQRTAAGLNYSELSFLTGIGESTLSRAAAGKVMPHLETVLAYATACRADAKIAMALWQAAHDKQVRHRNVRIEPGDYRRGVYQPEHVTSPATLARALRHLRLQSGNPTLAELAKRSGIPASTLSDLLNTGRAPRTVIPIEGFVQGCVGPAADLRPWRSAWMRAKESPPSPGKISKKAVLQYVENRLKGARVPQAARNALLLHLDLQLKPEQIAQRLKISPEGARRLIAMAARGLVPDHPAEVTVSKLRRALRQQRANGSRFSGDLGEAIGIGPDSDYAKGAALWRRTAGREPRSGR